MRAVRWMVITTIGLMLIFANMPYVIAAPTQQVEPSLELVIATAQAEATVGAPITWRVTLTPHGQLSIGHIELRPGGTRTWAWPDGVQTVEALTGTVVLDVSAVPLVSGDLRPILEAQYTVGKDVRTQLVIGDTSVQVEPIETRVKAGVIARQGTVRKGDRLQVELWIRNGSPFTLTQVRMRGSGADLEWGAPTVLEDILPGKTSRQMSTPTVEGQHPLPQLSIEYAWVDVAGISYTQTLYVSGNPVVLEENIIARIPDEVFGIIVGLIAGVLSTFFIGLVGDWLSRTLQKKVNRRHVRGLLRLITLQSEHAADNGVEIDLAPLETIFKEEGLFTIVEKDRLDQNVRDLWKTAECHNTGLSLPGGAQRSEELRKAARELGRNLDVLSAAEQDS